jgi:hypothetical protein
MIGIGMPSSQSKIPRPMIASVLMPVVSTRLPRFGCDLDSEAREKVSARGGTDYRAAGGR